MNPKNMDALFGMMNSTFQEKEAQENKSVLDALSDFKGYDQMAVTRIGRSRTHMDFGVEYDIPLNWDKIKDDEPNCVMYYAKGFDGKQGFMPAAFRMIRRRGDYRGYENVDRLERLALFASKESGIYDLKYITEVNIAGRKGVKAACIDHNNNGKVYDTDIYFFYKSKTEVLLVFCITAQEVRSYYKRVFNKILSSIRYIR